MKYKVHLYETYCTTYEVDAESEQEARSLVTNGKVYTDGLEKFIQSEIEVDECQ